MRESEGCRIVEEFFISGDIIVGLPQSISSMGGQGFKSGFLDLLPGIPSTCDIEKIFEVITCIPVIKDCKYETEIVIAAQAEEVQVLDEAADHVYEDDGSKLYATDDEYDSESQ